LGEITLRENFGGRWGRQLNRPAVRRGLLQARLLVLPCKPGSAHGEVKVGCRSVEAACRAAIRMHVCIAPLAVAADGVLQARANGVLLLSARWELQR
jgi:hypothetical protein